MNPSVAETQAGSEHSFLLVLCDIIQELDAFVTDRSVVSDKISTPLFPEISTESQGFADGFWFSALFWNRLKAINANEATITAPIGVNITASDVCCPDKSVTSPPIAAGTMTATTETTAGIFRRVEMLRNGALLLKAIIVSKAPVAPP